MVELAVRAGLEVKASALQVRRSKSAATLPLRSKPTLLGTYCQCVFPRIKVHKRGLLFQVFYFMQPDTTPLKLGRDITNKMTERSQENPPTNDQPQNDNRQETEQAQVQTTDDVSPITESSEIRIQVVPLYTPEGSAIKFFCVHPSHRYAMSLVPIATGFQGQVNSDTKAYFAEIYDVISMLAECLFNTATFSLVFLGRSLLLRTGLHRPSSSE